MPTPDAGPTPVDYVIALVGLVCAGDEGLRSAAFSEAASSLKDVSDRVHLAGQCEFYFHGLMTTGEPHYA